MSIVCLIVGCRWESGVVCKLGGELIRWQRCDRCAAHRYVAA